MSQSLPKPFLFSVLFALTAVGSLLAACTPTLYYQDDLRKRIAHPAWMIERHIPTDPYLLTAFERVHNQGGTARVYIEGDGKVRLSERSISRSPTPLYPVALHLASKDRSKNVIYLARPCQATQLTDPNGTCHYSTWTSKAYGPEVIDTYHQALNELKARYGFRDFDLFGYQGGGAIAGLMAAQRDDIKSFTTIAGRLNEIGNPVALFDVPQAHYVAANDTEVPLLVLDNYMARLGPSPCFRSHLIPETDEEYGWANRWGNFAKHPITCDTAGAYAMPLLDPAEDLPRPAHKPFSLDNFLDRN